MTTREVVLDANVIVGLLDSIDNLHVRAQSLLKRLEAEGATIVLLDFVVEEAVSVLCRRLAQRTARPPDLVAIRDTIDRWLELDDIQPSERSAVALAEEFDVVFASGGVLNSNDARLVILQRSGMIGEIATFDEKVAKADGLRCVQ